MMSYPNYGGEDKSLHHPDVLSLARAAERAGADVRVVLLMRDALGTVVSDTVHMHYGGKGGASGGSEREERILIDNAAALLAQTMLVDRRFVACADYDDRSLAWAGAVADALTSVQRAITAISTLSARKIGNADFKAPTLPRPPDDVKLPWDKQ